MKPALRKTFASALGLAAICFGSAPAAARPMSVRELAAQELRLSTIAYRMATATVDSCPVREAMTGLVLHDISRYEQGQRAAVSQVFSMRGGFGVLGVVPNSAAAAAGLQIDDEILAVGQYSVDDLTAFDLARSFGRMEQFDRILQSAAAGAEGGLIDLTVRRHGALVHTPIHVAFGCGGKLTLASSAKENAWSDGRNIIVTTGMTELSQSDDEIAFVIAHEMAHNLLGHLSGGGSRGIFGSSRVLRGEIEADSYAVRLMTRAGYQPAGGISFLERARRRMWWSFSLDHPGFGKRIAVVAEAMRLAHA
jgi:membrane-associated protease RseP (regulator of RpoE activity)